MSAEAIGEVVVFGVGVALSPLASVAIAVLILDPGKVRQAWAFFASWVLSLALSSTVVLLISDAADASDNGDAASWVSVVKLVLAVALVAFALRQWSDRSAGGAEERPSWMRKLDGITPFGAAGLAALFVLVKPKNLLLSIGAGIAVAQMGAPAGSQAIALAAFVLLGSAGLWLPLAIHGLSPRRGRALLRDTRDWMVRENATVIAVLCMVIAAKLLGDALVSLGG